MKISILFPTASEAAPYIERYGTNGVSICGIGLAQCAAGTVQAIVSEHPDFIILAGIAGAYKGSELKKGDTVNVVRENSADLGTMRGESFIPLGHNCQEYSGNYYVNDTILPDSFPYVISNTVNTAGTPFATILAGRTGIAEIENMEGAAFFAVCSAFGIKYAEFRCISNTIGALPPQWDIPLAASNLADSTAAFIKNLNMQ